MPAVDRYRAVENVVCYGRQTQEVGAGLLRWGNQLSFAGKRIVCPSRGLNLFQEEIQPW